MTMYANIRVTRSISNTLYYNEKKLQLNKAKCLTAGNFVKDVEHLTYNDKLYHYRRLTSLNDNILHEGLHISLNFHPSDKLSDKQLVDISHTYMREMGYGHQPYLVYQHHDAAHPHLHLMTINIQKDGSHLYLWAKDLYNSHKITREMEDSYHLVHSGKRQTKKQFLGQAEKITYGQTPTMPGLRRVVDEVLTQYNFTSLEELNAVMRLYNAEACRGKEDSRLYQQHGLLFRVLDEEGRQRGIPIKASRFDNKSTLDQLEHQFELNRVDVQREKHRQRVTTLLEWNMTGKNLDITGMQDALQRQDISMVWVEDRKTRSKSLFYIDHVTKCVFDGKELGGGYDVLRLVERLSQTQALGEKQVLGHRQGNYHSNKHHI